MPLRVVVVGGGAGGIGAAGGAKQSAPDALVTVFTEYEDVAYSPCGIPYVHGREIEDFNSLFLADKQAYVEAGIDIRYETRVTALDFDGQTVQITEKTGQRQVAPYNQLVLATGFDYASPGVPGSDLAGLYYVKNIRQAM